MKQVNIRFDDDEHTMLHAISSLSGKSIPALLKECAMNELRGKATELALKLYGDGKIGLKAAWKLSQLTFYEFSNLLVARGIEPSIPDELDGRMVERVGSIPLERIFPGKTVEELRRLLHGEDAPGTGTGID